MKSHHQHHCHDHVAAAVLMLLLSIFPQSLHNSLTLNNRLVEWLDYMSCSSGGWMDNMQIKFPVLFSTCLHNYILYKIQKHTNHFQQSSPMKKMGFLCKTYRFTKNFRYDSRCSVVKAYLGKWVGTRGIRVKKRVVKKY